jgi:hypothetical protein
MSHKARQILALWLIDASNLIGIYKIFLIKGNREKLMWF